MDKSRWLLILLFVQAVNGQVQNLTTDKNGNVVSPAGAKFGTGIPLRVVDAPSGGTDVVNKTYADSLVTGGGGGTVTSITATAPIVVTPSPIVNTGVISLGVADTTHNGYLSSTDWNTFNGKQNSITPSALTKSDDTNITLSLGGSPTTALLGAVSITAGWTGTLAVSRGGTGAATTAAHQYFGNNTGSTAAPGFHQIDYSELSGTPTVPSDVSAAHFVTTQSEAGLSAEFNLGSLASGLLKQTVAAGVSTPSIATSGTDYEVPLTFSQSVSRATNTVTLSGDSTSPGNTMLYGTNGSGTKGWYAQPSGGGTPGGSNTQVQFNDSSVFGGDAGMTYTKSVPKLTLSGTASSNSRFVVGTIEVQPLALNNSWIGENTYYDGSNFKYRATGSAGLFRFVGTEGQIGFFASGTAGTSLPSSNAQIKFVSDGSVAIGGGITSTTADYTGAAFVVKSAGTMGTTSTGLYGWTSSANAGVTIDTSLGRNNVGVVGVTNIADAVTGFRIGGAAGSGKILKGNGTNFVASTETYAAPGTSGNVLTSDGTNWTSAAPSGGAVSSITGTSPIVVSPTTGAAVASLNVGVDHAFTAAQSVTVNDALTNSFTDVLTIGHNSTGAATTGFGTGIMLKAEDSSTNDTKIGEIVSTWTTATHGTNRSTMTFNVNQGTSNPTAVMNLTGAGFVDAQNGFTINTTAPSSGRFFESDGTKMIYSSYSLPTAVGSLGQIMMSSGTAITMTPFTFPSASTTVGYSVRSDGTNYASYPQDMLNTSVASQSPSTSDVYLTNSNVTVAAGDFKQKGQYHCVFDMTKSAGTGAIVISVRIGTAGAIGDAQILTFTFGAGTSVADTGVFDVWVSWRSVGSGTSAVVQGVCKGVHNLATTGMFNNAASFVVIGSPSPSAGFNSNTATSMGLSFNGATAFAGTSTLCQATLVQ